jgi:SAM-dependent methyltransferase
MLEIARWNKRYEDGETPWDTGRPSSELERVLAEENVQPCRAIELGCGTGTNAVWLAEQGFDVTALDFSQLAIERARTRSAHAGVRVKFVTGDVLDPPEFAVTYDFLLDRGCYHVVRRVDAQRYLETARKLTHLGSLALVLTGNAKEAHDPGPPVVSEEEIRHELGAAFEIIRLREFRFDQVEEGGIQFLGWSCLLRRNTSKS